MSYLVTCSFNLKNATREDCVKAYADLAKIGLKRVIVSDQGHDVVAPTTMTIGELNGRSASSVRDNIRESVRAAFSADSLRKSSSLWGATGRRVSSRRRLRPHPLRRRAAGGGSVHRRTTSADRGLLSLLAQPSSAAAVARDARVGGQYNAGISSCASCH